MGVEYGIDLPLGTSMPAIGDLAERLSSFYELEAVAPDQVRLRLCGTARRPSWPEDITLSFTDRGMIVTLHSATRQQELDCLANLTSAYGDLGMRVAFRAL